jgi:hypothetical protein
MNSYGILTIRMYVVTAQTNERRNGKSVTLRTCSNCTRDEARAMYDEFKGLNPQIAPMVEAIWQEHADYL